MRIGILGAGAIGLLFASYLNQNFSVTLYTRTKEQAEDINKSGLILQKESEQYISLIKALPIEEWDGKEDLTIITVKQYQLPAIFERIKMIPFPKNLLFLQNGMAHLKDLNNVSAENIFVGTVEHGAVRINSHTVSHNGAGKTNVACFSGSNTVLQQLTSMAPLPFLIHLHTDFFEMLVNKLVVNAVVNPLTALLKVTNGELLENKFYRKAARSLLDEIVEVLNLADADLYFERMIEVCKQTSNNRSSMLKDVEEGRRTEIDAILGYLLDEAAKKGKRAPQIGSYYYLLRGKEFSLGGFS